MKHVLAIFCSDLHISHTPPVGRSQESDWYEAQKDILLQLQDLKDQTGAIVVYAGDITDKSNLSPECLNFMLEYLPEGYSIPGNHDLPNHSLNEISRSAYQTLVMSKKLVNIDSVIAVGQLRLHGFPYGVHVKPLRMPHSLAFEVAVIHSYVWKKDANHIGASKETRVGTFKESLRGYSHAIFGDNHIHFEYEFDHGCKLWNCGLFQRRRSDERLLRPSVGMLWEDGTITRHFLDCSKEVWCDTQEVASHFDASGLVSELEGLADSNIDFEHSVKTAICDSSIADETKEEILGAMK